LVELRSVTPTPALAAVTRTAVAVISARSLVDAVRASTDFACRVLVAVGVIAIDEVVAVLIDAAVAHLRPRGDAWGRIQELCHLVVIEGQSAVDRGIRPLVADVDTVETAASEELAHDLAIAVHDRRAAAATIRGAMMVRAIDELPSRECAAFIVTDVDLMMGKHLRTEVGITDPVKICAANRDRRSVKS